MGSGSDSDAQTVTSGRMTHLSREPLVVPRAWYASSIHDFVLSSSDAVLGELTSNSDFAVLPDQRDAWLAQIAVLKNQLEGIVGSLFFEFSIPRMGRRIDTVVIVGPIVFALEFKVGSYDFERAAIDQVWDYALDLKNFHRASHNASIVPILVITSAECAPQFEIKRDNDNVYRPISIDSGNLGRLIATLLDRRTECAIDVKEWARSPYSPTPTIVEAARALYANHSVEAIARYDAGATNLRTTSARVEELIDQAKAQKRKAICFVTGVPGAGKTLVGLNIATRRRHTDDTTHAVFLSGNGPLVAVLREALTRDELSRQKKIGNRPRKGKVAEGVKAFIQNVHHFRDDLLIDPGPPVEHVAIFDEAQRAWNVRKTADFMRRRKKRHGFSESEAQFLISCMDRHTDWAFVLCLVGGGQEINTGEAGIHSWIDAVAARFPDWDMYISSRLVDDEYGPTMTMDTVGTRARTYFDDSLHLAASMRSFRAENVSAFVKALLDCERREATRALEQFASRYPIVLSRNLLLAKQWIIDHARGTERYGLLASSKAHRLKPDAIDIRVDVDPVHWFLNDKDDTRSSYYLEDAATEFQVQGLEVDWACVAWDGDLRFNELTWDYKSFRGDGWCRIANVENRRYLRNAYRVLLTRARQGMVIYIPQGDVKDPTRLPAFYDSTFEYLLSIGIPELA
jgi:hypothetical protein